MDAARLGKPTRRSAHYWSSHAQQQAETVRPRHDHGGRDHDQPQFLRQRRPRRACRCRSTGRAYADVFNAIKQGLHVEPVEQEVDHRLDRRHALRAGSALRLPRRGGLQGLQVGTQGPVRRARHRGRHGRRLHPGDLADRTPRPSAPACWRRSSSSTTRSSADAGGRSQQRGKPHTDIV